MFLLFQKVSPFIEPPELLSTPWWLRYQPLSQILDTLSGNSTQFIDMTRRCNKEQVKIFVDISFNLKADPVIALGLVDLPDATENPEFLEYSNIFHYLNYLLSIGVAGFYVKCNDLEDLDNLERIFRTVDNLSTEFGFKEGARPVVLLETTSEQVKIKIRYHDTIFTGVSELQYTKEIAKVLIGNSLFKDLENLPEMWESIASNQSLVFIDPRDKHLSVSSKQYGIAMAFSLAYPYGIPKVMSSYDFKKFPNGPPTDAAGEQISPQFDTAETCNNGYMCEQRWRLVTNMVEFRRIVGDEPIENWWDNGKNQVVFSRGSRGFIVINMEGHDLEGNFQTGLPKGTYCDIVMGVIDGVCTGRTVTVNEKGFAAILLPADSRDGVLAIHVGRMVSMAILYLEIKL
jgi:alpha-amylase